VSQAAPAHDGQASKPPGNPVPSPSSPPAATDTKKPPATPEAPTANATPTIRGNYHVDFSVDGRFAVSGGKNATIRLYDIEKGVLLRTFSGQREPVTSIAFRQDASMVAAGSSEGKVAIWDARTSDGLDETERDTIGGDERIPLSGHDGPVRSLAFRPDGRELASGGEDGTIRYWRLPISYPESVWNASNDTVIFEAVPQSNNLVAGKRNGSVELWDLADSQTIELLQENSHVITALAISEDGSFAAVGDDSGKLRVIDLEARKSVVDQMVHEGGITGLKFHPKKSILISIGADGATRAMDLQSAAATSNQSVLNKFQSKGRLLAVAHGGAYAAVAGANTVEIADLKNRTTLHSLPVEGKEILALAWSAEDRTLLAGDSIGGIYAWRVPSGQKVFDSRIHEGPIRALAGNAQDSNVISGGADGKIRVWDQPGLAESIAELGKVDASQMAVTRNGQLVAIGATDGSIRLVDVEKKNIVATYPAVGKSPITIAFSFDGEWLAAAGVDGVVRVWNVSEGAESLVALETGAPVTQLAFTQTGPTLVASMQNGRFQTWKLPIQKSQSLAGHTDAITSVASNRSGSQIVTGGNDRVCRLFDADSGQQLRVFEGAQDGITSVVQASDDAWIAASDRAGQISMWRTESGDIAGSVQVSDGAITKLAGDSSNKLLASASVDGLLRIWRMPFTPPVSMQVAAQDSVVLALSPDGKRIALGLADNSIVIGDTRTGEQIQTLSGHEKAITALNWSTDSSFVVSGSRDETVSLWRISDAQRLVKWDGHKSPTQAVAIVAKGDELRAISAEGRLAAFTLATKQSRILQEPQKGVTALAISRSGNRLAVAFTDGTVQLVNSETGARIGKTAPADRVVAISWCADDESWVSVDSNRTVKYWKLSNLDASRGWSNAPKGLARICATADGSRLLVADADGFPQLRDAEGHVLQTFAWDRKIGVLDLALSEDGQFVIVAGNNGTTTVFQSSLVLTIAAHTGSASFVGFVDDRVLISTGEDQAICAWNISNGTQLRKFEGCPSRAIDMVIAKAESKLVVLGDDKRLYAWNLADGAPIELAPEVRDSSFRRIGMNTDGRKLAMLNEQGRLKILQLSDMTEIGDVASPVTDASSLAFLRNGAIVCTTESLGFVSRGDSVESGYKAHEGVTAGVVAVPGKDEILTAGDDGKIKVWSISGDLIRTLAEVDSPIRSIALSDDGSELIVLGNDNKLRTLTYAGESVGSWALGSRVKSLQYTGQQPQTVVTTSENQFRVYQSTKGKVVLTVTSSGKILASAVSSEKKLVYAVTAEGSLSRYAIDPSNVVDAEQKDVYSLALSKNNGSLVSGGEDGSVCVWKMPNLKLTSRLKGHSKPVAAVAFGRDELLVVSMSSEKSIKIWNVPGPKPLHTIALSSVPLSLSVSSDGKNLAVATKEKTASVYDIQSGKPSQSVTAEGIVILNAQYSQKGLMTLDADKRLSASETSAVRQFPQQIGPLTGLTVLKDGSYFMTSGPNAGVKVYDYSGKEIGEFEKPSGPVKSISVSPDNLWLAGYGHTGEQQKTLTIWNVADRQSALTITTPSPILSAKFEPEGTNVVVLGSDRQFRRYGGLDGKLLEAIAAIEEIRCEPVFHGSDEILTLESDDRVRLYQPALNRVDKAHTGAVTCLSYSGNGNLLFSGGADGIAFAWDATSRKPVGEFQAGNSPVNDIHILANQESLIVTQADNAARVWPLKWKASDPESVFIHKASVECAWTSQDNTLMASGGADKIVHLWLLAAGRELVQFRGHEGSVSRVLIAPDNKTVISFGDEDSIRVWKIPENAAASKTIGQVDRSTGMVAVTQPQDAEIDRLIKSISAPGSIPNLAEEQRKLDDLRNNRKSASIQGLNAADSGSQKIDREIQLVEKKIRTSVGQNRNKLRKELTVLKLRKNIENLKNTDSSAGAKLDAARKELEDFESGKSLNPVLDWESERPPGIEASLRSIKTNFVFDANFFRPVKLAISSDKTMIAAARESIAQAVGTPLPGQSINTMIPGQGMGNQIPGVVQLWDLESGALLRSWKENQLPKISSIAFSAKEKILLTVPDVTAYQALSGASQLLEKNACVSVGRAEGSTLVALGMTAPALNQLPILKFFDTDALAFRQNVISGYDAKVTALAFSPDCKTLYYCERGSRQHKLFEIDVQDPSKFQVIEEFDHPEHWSKLTSDGLGIEFLGVSSDKKYLVSYGQYGVSNYRLTTWAKSGDKWTPKNTYPSNQPLLRNNDPSRMWLIKDRPTQLCFEDPLGNVQTTDILTGKQLFAKQLKSTRWGKPETAHSEDGAWFVWGDDGGRMEVWDTRDSKQVSRTLKAHSGPIVGVAISIDGERIISAGEENLIKVWNTPKKNDAPKKGDSTKKNDSTKKKSAN
jgi:WD40 repeat protein